MGLTTRSLVLRVCQGCKLSFCEVPLLFECGYEGLFNEVIVVLRQKIPVCTSTVRGTLSFTAFSISYFKISAARETSFSGDSN